MKYSGETNSYEDMLENLASSTQEEGSPQLELSCIIDTTTQITPLVSLSEKENKREYAEAMDVEEGDTTKTPKKQKIEKLDKLL